MKTPRQIQAFIDALKQAGIADYNGIFNTFDFSEVNFKDFTSWSDKSYTRNCLYHDSDFELILLCWCEGQETSVHNHDGEDCWVRILKGEIEEEFFDFNAEGDLNLLRSQIVTASETTFINDEIALHRLKNNFEGRSMSLHLYAKPIEQCRSYNEANGEFVKKELRYDSEQDVLDGTGTA
ncbi:cysteine dioxygenase [Subsaximicrobium wynnwilliamsii]|uniref:cysteine dioxygenase n=1 Tax=Subsaximicrobium wynnwilliamsii TaxID=291179 RepID=UPI0016794818|nr:cysteine dioxygenase family protein [Subsaximicrobium wynnwilliamsii]